MLKPLLNTLYCFFLFFAAAASARELYSGEATNERTYLWGSYYMAEDGCQNSAINEPKQNQLCGDSELAKETDEDNQSRKLGCEEAGGLYEVKMDERREVETRRHVVPIVCKVACIKISRYICQAKPDAPAEETNIEPELALPESKTTPEKTPENTNSTKETARGSEMVIPLLSSNSAP